MATYVYQVSEFIERNFKTHVLREKDLMNAMEKDKEILRELGKRIADIAYLPVQYEG